MRFYFCLFFPLNLIKNLSLWVNQNLSVLIISLLLYLSLLCLKLNTKRNKKLLMLIMDTQGTMHTWKFPKNSKDYEFARQSSTSTFTLQCHETDLIVISLLCWSTVWVIDYMNLLHAFLQNFYKPYIVLLLLTCL